MKNITDSAVTSVVIPEIVDEAGQPIIFTIENHELHLPLAGDGTIGLVKGVSESASEEDKENKISINEDGTMSVYTLNVNRLVQSEEDELIMGAID